MLPWDEWKDAALASRHFHVVIINPAGSLEMKGWNLSGLSAGNTDLAPEEQANIWTVLAALGLDLFQPIAPNQ